MTQWTSEPAPVDDPDYGSAQYPYAEDDEGGTEMKPTWSLQRRAFITHAKRHDHGKAQKNANKPLWRSAVSEIAMADALSLRARAATEKRWRRRWRRRCTIAAQSAAAVAEPRAD